jgi:hypothetical protein
MSFAETGSWIFKAKKVTPWCQNVVLKGLKLCRQLGSGLQKGQRNITLGTHSCRALPQIYDLPRLCPSTPSCNLCWQDLTFEGFDAGLNKEDLAK